MRRKIAAGNWKMNLMAEEAAALAKGIAEGCKNDMPEGVEVMLSPPFVHLSAVAGAIDGNDKIHLAGQNMHEQPSGAYTGEVSAPMLASVGCSHVLIGHSERRQYFGEDNGLLNKKIRAALNAGLRPVYCLGESLAQREAEETFDVVGTQLAEGCFDLEPGEFSQLVIAYEPVWAIGTGVTATPEQAQEVHAYLRAQIREQYGAVIADDMPILYGGSVKPANAGTLFRQPDIDGGLVGGASLKADDFLQIIRAFA